jgi:hypothetical protein
MATVEDGDGMDGGMDGTKKSPRQQLAEILKVGSKLNYPSIHQIFTMSSN